MHVTRDVVRDLLPAYPSGEASADTNALVESFAAGDPALAREVEWQWSSPCCRCRSRSAGAV